MSGVLLFALCGMACVLLSRPNRRWRQQTPGSRGKSRRRSADGKSVGGELPRYVRQLSSLMVTGRSGPTLWESMAEVLQGGDPHGVARKGLEGSASLVIVLAVQRATLMGIPTAESLRLACQQRPNRSGGGRRIIFSPNDRQVKEEWRRAIVVWCEIAACFEICERSGAPLAAVVSRLADRLDNEMDAEAMRATALAGPQATVRLLTWLPFIGLGLGMAMGVDPLSVLLGSPLGWVCLICGLALVLIGKWWAGKLVDGAKRDTSDGTGGAWNKDPNAAPRQETVVKI